MNVQNAKNLSITEGDVKTIHDKDNQLLWGAVGYDTKYEGDTYQQTYSGKNLYNKDGSNILSAYIDSYHSVITSASNNRLIWIECKPNTSYTITKLPVDYSRAIAYTTEQPDVGVQTYGFFVGSNNWSTRTYTTGADAKYLVIRLWVGGQDTSTVEEMLNAVQIEEGSTATTYEPYCGGIPSPNPDYPQDIQVVTGEQTVNVHGKNLLNPTLFDGITQNSDGTLKTTKYYTVTTAVSFHLKASTRYTLSIRNSDGELTGQGWGVAVNGTWINTTSGVGAVNTDASGEVSLQIGASSYGVIGNWNSFIQLEQGNQPTTYEPYQSQDYTVDLGSTELCKIGDYQDYIYKSGDNWYMKKFVNNHILDPINDLWTSAAGNVFYAEGITDYATSNNIPVCTFLLGNTNVSGLTAAQSMADNHCAFINISGSTSPRFYIKSTKFGSGSDFINYITNNVTSVYYALATPTDTQITDATLISQLNSIHDWLTRYGYSATVSGSLPLIINQTNLI